MPDASDPLLNAVFEIRDLIRIMAAPAIAEWHANLGSALRQIVGKSSVKAKAVLLMDGSRTQAEICASPKFNPTENEPSF